MFKDTMKEIMDQLEAYGPYFELDEINDNTADGLCSITIDGSKITLEELEQIVQMFSNYPEFAPTSTVKTDDKIVYYFKDNRNVELDETSDNENKDNKTFLMSPSEFRNSLNESNTNFYGVDKETEKKAAHAEDKLQFKKFKNARSFKNAFDKYVLNNEIKDKIKVILNSSKSLKIKVSDANILNDMIKLFTEKTKKFKDIYSIDLSITKLDDNTIFIECI